jgi:putative transcriptional regulator
MPVVVKRDELLQARGMTLTQLAERVDMTLANLSILKTGKAGAIRFSTLEAICQEAGMPAGRTAGLPGRGGMTAPRGLRPLPRGLQP